MPRRENSGKSSAGAGLTALGVHTDCADAAVLSSSAIRKRQRSPSTQPSVSSWITAAAMLCRTGQSPRQNIPQEIALLRPPTRTKRTERGVGGEESADPGFGAGQARRAMDKHSPKSGVRSPGSEAEALPARAGGWPSISPGGRCSSPASQNSMMTVWPRKFRRLPLAIS